MARFLIVLGLAILLMGLLWPYLSKLGLGRLPGDIVIERENVTLYIPLATCLMLSFVLSLILWVATGNGRAIRARHASTTDAVAITAGTAGCGWCEARQARVGRSNTARRGIPRP